LANKLETGVRAKGYDVITERTQDTGSGIVSFRHPFVDCRSIVGDLARNRIVAAPRQGWIRMSPHFYISPEEIEHVVQVLPAV